MSASMPQQLEHIQQSLQTGLGQPEVMQVGARCLLAARLVIDEAGQTLHS